MKTKRIERIVHGVRGEGPTVQAAKDNARERIERAFSDEENYQPEIFRWRGITTLMFRTLDGWGYAFLEHPSWDGGGQWKCEDGKLWGNSGNHETYKECRRQMRRHVADIGWTREDGTFVPDFVDAEDRAELESNHQWQLYILEAREAGITEDNAMRYYANVRQSRYAYGQHVTADAMAQILALLEQVGAQPEIIACVRNEPQLRDRAA